MHRGNKQRKPSHEAKIFCGSMISSNKTKATMNQEIKTVKETTNRGNKNKGNHE